MSTETAIPSLASLEYIPFIDTKGQLPEQFQSRVGVYAIFDREQKLQYVGYSRDVDLSLKQHLVRQPQKCYWLKVQTTDRPSRAFWKASEKLGSPRVEQYHRAIVLKKQNGLNPLMLKEL